MSYATAILTYLSDLKARAQAVIEENVGGWTVYPYQTLHPGGRYWNIWDGPAQFGYGTSEQWLIKRFPLNLLAVAGFLTEGYKTHERSDVQRVLDDMLPAFELALISSAANSLISAAYPTAPVYLWSISPQLVSDDGTQVFQQAGVPGQVIGQRYALTIEVQLNITGV